MADAYTGVGASSVDQSAYDLAVYHALRPMLYADRVADVQSTSQSFNGAAVIFTQQADLSAVTTALNESTDVTAVALSDAQVTLTLVEFGNAVITTHKLRATSFVPFDQVVANVVGWNAGLSMDTYAFALLAAGSNVRYAAGNLGLGGVAAGARSNVGPTELLGATDVRRALADLRGANVMDFGGYYTSFIHPDVSYDLRGQTGAAAWRDPHTYSQPDEIWQGEIGAFEGFRFVETPTAPLFADAGSSTTLTDVYATIFLGRQAFAKAYSHADGNGPFPQYVQGPVTDKLRRNVPAGWLWLGQYGVFRQASLRRVESASSIGANT